MGANNTGSDFLGFNRQENVMYRAQLVWNTNTLTWDKATGSAGAGNVTVTNFPAVQPVSGTVAVSNMVAQGLTDAQLRAVPVPVSGTVAVSNMVAQGITDAQLRAVPVPVSGTVAVSNMVLQGLTDAQLRATPAPAQGYYYDIETATVLAIKGVNGSIGAIDYLTLIGTGKIAGHTLFRGFGEAAAAVSGDDIWEGVTAIIPLPNQTTGEQVTFVSTSAADAAAGTGMRTLDFHYLDAAGNPQTEIIALNGITPVNSVAVNVRFTQVLHGQTWGTGGAAAGTITCYKLATPATIYNQITLGGNHSLSSARMVPLGKTYYMTGYNCSATSGNGTVRLRSTSTEEGVLTSGANFLYKDTQSLNSSAIPVLLSPPLVFPALCIIKGTIYNASGAPFVSISYIGWIE